MTARMMRAGTLLSQSRNTDPILDRTVQTMEYHEDGLIWSIFPPSPQRKRSSEKGEVFSLQRIAGEGIRCGRGRTADEIRMKRTRLAKEVHFFSRAPPDS